jgi:hypothetical protein
VTLVDELVLARSVYNHSMNYRSVVVLGRAREVTGRTKSSGQCNGSSTTWFRGAGTMRGGPTRADQGHHDPRAAAGRSLREDPTGLTDDDCWLPVWAG